jgi:hypothetical protein
MIINNILKITIKIHMSLKQTTKRRRFEGGSDKPANEELASRAHSNVSEPTSGFSPSLATASRSVAGGWSASNRATVGYVGAEEELKEKLELGCTGCRNLVDDETGCPRCLQVYNLTCKLWGKEDVIDLLREQLRETEKKLAKFTGIPLPKEEDLYCLRDDEEVDKEIEEADDPRHRSYFKEKKRRKLLKEAVDLTDVDLTDAPFLH